MDGNKTKMVLGTSAPSPGPAVDEHGENDIPKLYNSDLFVIFNALLATDESDKQMEITFSEATKLESPF